MQLDRSTDKHQLWMAAEPDLRRSKVTLCARRDRGVIEASAKDEMVQRDEHEMYDNAGSHASMAARGKNRGNLVGVTALRAVCLDKLPFGYGAIIQSVPPYFGYYIHPSAPDFVGGDDSVIGSQSGLAWKGCSSLSSDEDEEERVNENMSKTIRFHPCDVPTYQVVVTRKSLHTRRVRICRCPGVNNWPGVTTPAPTGRELYSTVRHGMCRHRPY
ncbi:hypothetical protein EVAR_13774_1 [Eumeta japonica]|uniref:Uncharacterized protein n=1 Tax=Eumeta variegata TaxID=151549 RepID=A0A4C1U1A1_EUMVA|nr:hypothetical protein EVAR_13774_1 [Eumeta japonica]